MSLVYYYIAIFWPLDIKRYFCLGLFGFFGIVYSISPAFIKFLTCLFNSPETTLWPIFSAIADLLNSPYFKIRSILFCKDSSGRNSGSYLWQILGEAVTLPQNNCGLHPYEKSVSENRSFWLPVRKQVSTCLTLIIITLSLFYFQLYFL